MPLKPSLGLRGFSALVWGAASLSSPTISCSHEDKHDELHQNSSKQLHKGLPGPLAVIRSMLGIARHAEEDTP